MTQPLVKEYVSSTLEVAIAEMETDATSTRELALARTKAQEALFWYEKHLEELQRRCKNQLEARS